ncbi:MAG: leucine-rich repeat protein [Eubacterium sp.]|nr:leucine-rich repeat protein [Eubacterium sp.]
MKKSAVFIMFMLCMALLLFPCTAFADDYPTSGTCGENLTWKLERAEDEGGAYTYTLTISGTGDMGVRSFNRAGWTWARQSIDHIVIEDGVTSICYLGGALVQSVTLPDSVKMIGSYAFANCYALTDVLIPDSVTEIGNRAFADCESLEHITIPDSVTSIYNGAFYHCGSLKQVTIPASVTEIKYLNGNEGVFEGCGSLRSVEIRNGLTEIGTEMFKDCISLADIEIPESVTMIRTGAFAGCGSLTDITIPESVTDIYGYYGSGAHMERGAFYGCSSLTEIAIPKSVTCIGEKAFQNCAGLERVNLSNSAADVAGNTFGGCEKLSEFAVSSDNPVYSVENGILFNKNKRKIICFPQGRTGEYQIPDRVTAIGKYAFYDCKGLNQVTMPDGVTIMEDGAFQQSGLLDVEIPGSITYIDNDTFRSCRSLKDVVIRDGVREIGESAFNWCDSLTDIVIPDGVEWINEKAFESCTSLASVTIPGSVKKIEYNVFGSDNALRDVYYAKSEKDWDSITEGYIGFYEKDVAMHYNSRGDFSCFQTPSTTYDNRLALIAADMSAKAEEGEEAIRALYESYGLSDCEYSNFGFNESAAFAIGQKTLEIDGVDTIILVITARGSTTWWEFIGDLFKGAEIDFLGTKVWGNVHEFYETVWNGMRGYIYNHEDLWTKQNLKILINGHSLGGAAANMLGAMLTNKDGANDEIPWGTIGKENIYVYTFGTIKVLTEENKVRNISVGYENIHNIYNYYDSFGPNGNWKDQNASAIKAKFGHTELYYLDEGESGWLMWDRTSNNHNMSNYKKALEQNKVSCSERAKEKSKKRIEKMENQLSGIWQGVKRIISQIAVLCPVDVEIYASDGSLAGSVTGDEAEVMLPGKVYICTEGDRKYAYLLDDDNYTVKLKGTDAGTMTYSVQNIDMDTGEVMGEKTFTDVSLASGKQFSSSVAVEENVASGIAGDEIKLFVVKEGGEAEKEVLADGNGTETAIEKKPEKPEDSDNPGDKPQHPGGTDSDNKKPNEGKPDNKNPGGNGTDGKADSVKVKKIKIYGISKKIAAGRKITLKAAVSPSNVTKKSVTWKSDNKKYATVNSKGVVMTKKAGAGKTVTISAAAKDGSGKKASYKIKIMKGVVKEVKISGKTACAARSGTTVKLKASVKASNGANKVLQWKSGNKKYASVNGKGKVTLKKAGKGKTVRITAMATDGSGKKATVKIKIK